MISGIKWQLPRTEAWLIMAPLWPPLKMPAPVDNGRVCVCYGLSPLLLWFPGSICVIQNANGRLYGPSRGLAYLQVHSLLVVSKRFFWLKEDPELHYELFDNKNRLNGCVCRVFMWVCVLASVCVSGSAAFYTSTFLNLITLAGQDHLAVYIYTDFHPRPLSNSIQ